MPLAAFAFLNRRPPLVKSSSPPLLVPPVIANAMAAAASPSASLARSTSTHTTTAARGTHHFNVVGYAALLRQASPGESIASSPFRVGGYDWAIRFFPAGRCASHAGRVGLVVELLSDAPFGAKACYSLDLADDPFSDDGEPVLCPMILGTGQTRWGFLPESRFVEARDDRITIVCTVEVLLQAGPSGTAAGRPFIAVPPPNMSEHLLRILHTKRGCDVTFEVEGREFEAHTLLMRTRAPGFSAQTLGPLAAAAKGGGRLRATIADMKADDFEAVLRFIYTDEAPPEVGHLLLGLDDAAADEKARLTAKVRGLLVAARRFGQERMVLMCEHALGAAMDAESAAVTLRLADKHGRGQLKAACIDYMVSSTAVLREVMATEGFQQLKDKGPASLLACLLEKLALA